ncbi:MAG: DUF2252 family protein [Acidobacteriota bacterium]
MRIPDASIRDRSADFRAFARQRALGEVLVPPHLLPAEERRVHVRQTLLEDHVHRLYRSPDATQSKFDKIARSAFDFFRGTALLFYRDQAGTDGHLPQVLVVGDVHPENYGIMPDENGEPFFGLNDFDEAHVAPFSWDVKRGAVGFYLAGRHHDLAHKICRRIARDFAAAYIDGLHLFAQDDSERHHRLHETNSPELIAALIADSKRNRRDWLSAFVDLDQGRFRTDHAELDPASDRIDDIQAAIDRYRQINEVPQAGRAGHYRVKDVAIKHGSGTASLGLDRFFVLIESARPDHGDDVILEMKQARDSALLGLTPPIEHESAATQIVTAHDVHLAGGDPYYGHTELGNVSYLVRERSPYKDSIDLEDLDRDNFLSYAKICGRVLAQAHARADRDGGLTGENVELRILRSVHRGAFPHDMSRFAEAAARRTRHDWRAFCDDYGHGVFFVDDD